MARRLKSWGAAALGMLIGLGALDGSMAQAQPAPKAGRLVSTLARYCIANHADPEKVRLEVGADWTALKEVPYELIGALGGPFSSYQAWSIPQGAGQHPIVLLAGLEQGGGIARKICSVRGVEDGDTIAEVRALMGGARPFTKEETLWGAFGWEEGDGIREPTQSEFKDASAKQHIVAFSIVKDGDQAAISMLKAM